jgi:hypothetical protein
MLPWSIRRIACIYVNHVSLHAGIWKKNSAEEHIYLFLLQISLKSLLIYITEKCINNVLQTIVA